MLSRTLNSHSRLVVAISSPQNVSQLVLSRYVSNGSFYDRTKSKLFEAMSVYEEIIGIKEVKQAQDSVTNAEKSFSKIQNERRQINLELIDAQQKLRKLRDEMDRLSRTDSNYLKLFTEEHGLLKHESKLIVDYKLKEDEERSAFFELSSRLREAQEHERIRVERTKYLQFGLSILGATLGILSTYLFNYKRNSNIREILEYDKEHFKSLEDSVQSILEKQEGFESAMNKWNSSFRVNDVSPDENLVLNSGEGELIDEEQAENFLEVNSTPSRDLTNIYVNAAFLSIVIIASCFYYFKNN